MKSLEQGKKEINSAMKTKIVLSVGVSGLWRHTPVLVHKLPGDKLFSQL